MKKKNLRSLKLNKKRISTFDSSKVIVGGGTINQTCAANTRARRGECQFCEPQ
jgi:hypothetical protein